MNTITTLILETIKNNFTTDSANYAGFRDYIRNDFINDSDNYADFRDYIKIVLPVTRLILEIT